MTILYIHCPNNPKGWFTTHDFKQGYKNLNRVTAAHVQFKIHLS